MAGDRDERSEVDFKCSFKSSSLCAVFTWPTMTVDVKECPGLKRSLCSLETLQCSYFRIGLWRFVCATTANHFVFRIHSVRFFNFQVDDEVVSLPFLREPYIYVERQTNTILLNTNIGLKVHTVLCPLAFALWRMCFLIYYDFVTLTHPVGAVERPFTPGSERAGLLQGPHLWSLWELQQLLPGWPPNAQRTTQPVRVWLWQQLEGKTHTSKKDNNWMKASCLSDNVFPFRWWTVAAPSQPVNPGEMLTPVRTQVTRPRRALMLAVRCWSPLSLSPAIGWCLPSRGTEPACTISVPAGPTVTSVCATPWRPTPVGAGRPESSWSGGARRCVVRETRGGRKPAENLFFIELGDCMKTNNQPKSQDLRCLSHQL